MLESLINMGEKFRVFEKSIVAKLMLTTLLLFCYLQGNAVTAIEFNSPKKEARFYFKRGKTKLQLEDWSGANSDFDRVLELFPNKFKAYNLKAYAKTMQGQIGTAYSYYNDSLEIKRKQKPIYFKRGMTNIAINFPQFNSEDDLIEINSDLKKLKKAKLRPVIFNNLAIVNFLLGESTKAQKYLNKASKKNKNDDLVYYNKALVEYQNGDIQLASSSVSKSLETNNGNSFSYNLSGIIEINQGDFDSALEDLNSAVELDNRCAVYYYNRAHTEIMLEDFSNADSDYETARESFGLTSLELFYIDNNQMYTKLKIGDYSNGLSLINSILSSSVSDVKKANAIYNRGFITYLQGDEVAGTQDLLLAVSMNSNGDYKLYSDSEADFALDIDPNINTIFQFEDITDYNPTGGDTLTKKINCTSFSQMNQY